MASEDVETFYQWLEHDPGLRESFERIDPSAGRAAWLRAVVALGREHGLEFSEKEFERVSEELAGRGGGGRKSGKPWWKFW
ncbi:Nif11-like leader peptide family natural product precursor [Desulfohalovibrio reitneri]|uniref:Nif11-like leader peptide family natural product precursor n=1 Tax=Desulfohalovibrio reitneri TaxID=1307759 RepID=UPI0004A77CDD|nr:Nif11-like leader peptide family natural product precursor [Desulfohalovibrio reitneri]